MNKIIKLIPIVLMLTILNESLLKAQSAMSFEWQQLSSIPDQIGFAGSYAGVAGNVLIVAGGANFPDGGAPWTGSKKAWSAQLFVLDQPNGAWKVAGNLPQKMGYGISINYKDAMILIGGSNEQGHLKSVYKFTYNDAKLKFEMLPDLPKPIANTCGVLVGDVIYVMGGITDPDAKTAGNNFWALDLSQEKKAWHILPTWPGAARMLSVAGALNDELYLFSGVALIDGQRKYLNDAYKFTSKNVWEKIADLPHSVAAAPTPAFASKKEIMVFGGDDGSLAPTSATLKENHPGFSKQILAYNAKTNNWCYAGDIKTHKRTDAVSNPNASIWAPVTTSLTVWNGAIILPGGEVRPATRTPNVLMAKPINNKLKLNQH